MTLPPDDGLPGEFALAGWRVLPSLNRLEQPGSTVRVEPKLMDVLCFLARRPRQVVTKAELAAAVWPDVFVTDAVITRAIAGLRRAFGDDAQSPRVIETIPKRGYRLLAVPAAAAASPAAAPPARDSPPWRNAVGQWVRGADFHGREALLAEVLDGPRNGVWLLGSRACGKTSTLRQLEHLTADARRGWLPVYWDLQGSDAPERLAEDLHEALRDVQDRLAALDLDVESFAGDDVGAAVGRLRRACVARGLRLLLLLDEAEELLDLATREPALPRKLRRALLSADGIRTVLAASGRLWRLAEPSHDTSPFLHGFAPPLYLGPLDAAAAEALVARALGAGADPALRQAVVRRCGGHPYLLRLFCARLREGERVGAGLDDTAAAVGADAAVGALFAVDLALLSAEERAALLAVARDEAPPASAGAALQHLARLGTLRALGGGRFEVASAILRDWLRGRAAGADPQKL